MIGRRDFITLLGGAAATWPLAARAQPGKLPIIGILGSGSPAGQGQWYAGFVQQLRELGWTEGRNVAIEYRWAEGLDGRFAEIAAEYVRRKVDVIVTSGNSAIAVAKQTTSVIPIVFAVAGDPVGTGLVENLARPGGNVTGLSGQGTDTTGKRLELLQEVVPGLQRLAVLAHVGSSYAALEMREVASVARPFGLDATLLEIRSAQDIAPAIAAVKGRVQALYVVTDTFAYVQRIRIHTVTLAAQLPTMHGFREYVEAGGLMSYGASFPDLWRRAAVYVDKILRGSKPSDLPVEQPTKFELVINLITAKALGIEMPPTLLARADEVIE
jgi:putative ABC transport system substrate-binding protein